MPFPQDGPNAPDSVISLVYDLVRTRDLIGVRQLELTLQRSLPAAMIAWRTQHEETRTLPPDGDPLFADSLLQGAVLERFVFAFAAVTSQQPEVADQSRTLDAFLPGSDWNGGGRTVLSEAHRGLIYLFHYLHGALSLEIGRADLALTLATTAVPSRGTLEAKPLWRQDDLTSAPAIFGRSPLGGWRYLREIWTRVPIFQHFFASPGEFERGLAAYSILLLLLEFATNAAELQKSPENQGLRSEVTPLFIDLPAEVLAAGARRTVNHRGVVDQILQHARAGRSDLEAIWPRIKAMLNQLARHQSCIWRVELPLGELA